MNTNLIAVRSETTKGGDQAMKLTSSRRGRRPPLRVLPAGNFLLKSLLGLSLFLLPSVARGVEGPVDVSEGERFFENRVRPILVENCGECHGSEKRFAGLRVDSWQSLAEGSDSAPVVIPGDAEKSLLIAAVRRENGLEMPPDDPLAAEHVETLVRWVRLGAPWPESEPVSQDSATERARRHWAFRPIVEPVLPSVSRPAWVRTAVDAFVLAALDDHELAPSPPADRRTLIRRASYLVTGLPPTPDEIDRFVSSNASDAYERLVEELLASPHYGEQWARHWLDVARYSDSKGYVYAREERFWTHAWTYRDWVVRALNRDLPYDEFLLLQLAADQVAESPQDLAAMGFLTVGRRFLGVKHDIIDDRIDVVSRGMMGLTVSCARCHDHKFDPIPTDDYYSLYGVFDSCIERERSLSEPGELDDAYLAERNKRQQALAKRLAEVRLETAERVRDRAGDYLNAQFELEKYPDETFGQLFQKSDLLPAIVRRWKDYLRDAEQRDDPVFAAWHRFTRLADLPDAEFAPAARRVWKQLQQEPAERVNPLVAAAFHEPPTSLAEVAAVYGNLLADIRQQNAKRKAAGHLADVPPEKVAESRSEDPAAESLRQVLYGPTSPCEIPDEPIVEIESMLDNASTTELWKLQAAVDRWVIGADVRDRRARILVDRDVPEEPRVFRRGDPLRKEATVPRQFLSLLSPDPPQPFAIGSGRLELARNIIDPKNPLTARVLVNRVWGHYFGRPLVETPSDFGLRASSPSHPELLDHLAARFIDEGWSLKELHRQILLSSTFRQADSGPEDPSIRARAEQTDPSNRWLWRWQPRRLTLEEMRDSLIAASNGLDRTVGGKPVDELWEPPFSQRRTLYGTVDRQFLPGLMRVFDFANPDLHIAQRAETTAPQQALFFLNHPLVLRQSRKLAADIAGLESPERRIDDLFQSVLLRQPEPSELDDALRFLAAAEAVQEEPSSPTRGDWSYGYGEIDESLGRTRGFTPLPHFGGQAWQGGPGYPDQELGWVKLDATGGHPGNDRAHAAVRRWTAPQAMEIRIDSTLTHEPPQGDGVRGFIVSSKKTPGILAEAHAHQQTRQLDLEPIRVAAGETIDFVVDIGDGLSHDQYHWRATIVGTAAEEFADSQAGETVWDSENDFAGDQTRRLSPWEQLAQILLCTNEFLFVP